MNSHALPPPSIPSLSESDAVRQHLGPGARVVSGQWVGVIDDREGTRVAWLSIDLPGPAGGVAQRMMALTAGPGVDERIAREADLEAVVALPDGTFLMGEEGHCETARSWQPAILHVTRDGVVTRDAYPPEFAIAGRPIRGARQPGLRKPDAHAERPRDRRPRTTAD